MSEPTTRVRARRTDGERTHAAIVETAARVASVEGIHGLTIGRLAKALDVSKSGLYAHFGSKEALQLETVETAKEIFDREVMQPAFEAPEGVPQLEAVLEGFFSYVERGVFPGGCFFAGLLAEEDARSGPVHDVVVAWERESVDALAELAQAGKRLGQIAGAVDAHQLAFELYAFIEMTNFHFILFRDPQVLERGRTAVRVALARAERGT